MEAFVTGPAQAPLAVALFAAGAMLLARSLAVYRRSRREVVRGPMLLPIRAWRHLILGMAVLIGGVGFAVAEPWVIVFALVLGFVETLEASMMVSALSDEQW